MASRLVQGAIAAVVVAAAAAGGWWATHRSPALPSSAEIGAEEAAFAFTECKARLLDGSPAIAVMFTQALDRRPGNGLLEGRGLGGCLGQQLLGHGHGAAVATQEQPIAFECG